MSNHCQRRLPSYQPHLDKAQGLGPPPLGSGSLLFIGWVSRRWRRPEGVEVSRHRRASLSQTGQHPCLKLQAELSALATPLGPEFPGQRSQGGGWRTAGPDSPNKVHFKLRVTPFPPPPPCCTFLPALSHPPLPKVWATGPLIRAQA